MNLKVIGHNGASINFEVAFEFSIVFDFVPSNACHMSKCQPLSSFRLLAVAKYKRSTDLKFPKSRVAQRVSALCIIWDMVKTVFCKICLNMGMQ